MKRITIFCGVLAILGTIAVFWQQQSFVERQENYTRGFTNEVLIRSRGAIDVAHEQEIIFLREQIKDLAKLRNEVGRLRAARTELAAARTESTRLTEAKQTATPAPPTPLGFTARQQLANVGFATPEATLQTFFWAMNEGNLETALQALSPNNRERKSFDKLSPEQRAIALKVNKMHERDAMMTHFNDFGIREREEISDGVVVLHVGSSLATNTMRMSLQRLNGEWKLKDFPQ